MKERVELIPLLSGEGQRTGIKFVGHTGIDPKTVFQSHEQFARDHTSVQLRAFCKDKARVDIGEDREKTLYSELIWEALLPEGEFTMSTAAAEAKDGGTATKLKGKVETPKAIKKYTFVTKNAGAWGKAPKQVKDIMEIVVASKQTEFVETDLDNLLQRGVKEGKLVTKQAPMRVFKYYIPKMRDELAILNVA